MQTALVQEHDVLDRVQADHEVGLQHGPVDQGVLELGELLVQRVDDLHLAVAQDLLPVRQAAGDPALEDVVALGQLRRTDDAPLLALPRAHEQDESAPRRDLLHDLGRTAEVGRRDVQRDYVDPFSDTEDVAGILRVPAGRRVSEMRLVGEEEFECDVLWPGRGSDEVLRFIRVRHVGTETVEYVSCQRKRCQFSA